MNENLRTVAGPPMVYAALIPLVFIVALLLADPLTDRVTLAPGAGERALPLIAGSLWFAVAGGWLTLTGRLALDERSPR